MSDFDNPELLEEPPSRRSIGAGMLRGKLRGFEAASIKHAHRFIIRRWKNLQETRKHVLAWLLLLFLLSGTALLQTVQTKAYYQVAEPSSGGTYTEGVIGAINSLNPIFAGTQAELSASRLLFAGLVQYDDTGAIVGDLAQSWTSDASGKVYTIKLRHTARWSDGAPITADDVVYTFSIIQNADTQSPLYSSWSNVSVEKLDADTVRFTLPTAYAPFMDSLTVGILPQHVLGSLQPLALRNFQFNRAPTVTSGPFTFQDMRALDSQNSHYLVDMLANQDYFAGPPKLNRFQLYTYADQDTLLKAYQSQEIAAVSGLDTEHVAELHDANTVVNQSPLYDGVYAFFNLDNPVTADANVRKALELATNRAAILAQLGGQYKAVTGPLLPGQLGYASDLAQAAPDIVQAGKYLDASGWALNNQGKRVKGGQLLIIHLKTITTGEYPTVAQMLMSQWARLGITFDSQESQVLIKPEQLQQNYIQSRSYDVLVYDIALGSDPDVYAFWDSSQANPQGLNLSQYKSARADAELESARITLNPTLRAAKYRAFTQTWLADVPAVGLYQPNLNYVQNKSLTSFGAHPLPQATDRYFNVIYWSAGMQQLVPTL